MIEIDPREGSGVIPLDWAAFLRAKDQPLTEVRGTVVPQLRNAKALAGVVTRDYNYDVFWVVFPPASEGKTLFSNTDRTAELIVTIYGKEGRVDWTIPASIREKTAKFIRK